MSSGDGTEAALAARTKAIYAMAGAGVSFRCTQDYEMAVGRTARLIVEHERVLRDREAQLDACRSVGRANADAADLLAVERDALAAQLAEVTGQRDRYQAALKLIQEPCEVCGDGPGGESNCPAEDLHAIADEALDKEST